MKNEILNALSAVSDPGQRVVLTILIRVLDEISVKLDRVLSDEDKIKHIVLNGDAGTHSAEHQQHRELNKEWAEIKPALDLIRERNSNGGYCDYAERMLLAEKAHGESKRKVAESLIEKTVWGGVMLVVGLLLPHVIGYLK